MDVKVIVRPYFLGSQFPYGIFWKPTVFCRTGLEMSKRTGNFWPLEKKMHTFCFPSSNTHFTTFSRYGLSHKNTHGTFDFYFEYARYS